MGNGWSFVKCQKCKSKKAVYRCASNSKLDSMDAYHRTAITIGVDPKNSELCQYEHRYTCCEDCSTRKIRDMFTLLPGGWKEHIQYAETYEAVKSPVSFPATTTNSSDTSSTTYEISGFSISSDLSKEKKDIEEFLETQKNVEETLRKQESPKAHPHRMASKYFKITVER